ncbi:MAG: hypothetical protein KF752_17845 [Pirellulaceae bacterium]|nr:hypothetical protein [Pirellulaceae bacterium]
MISRFNVERPREDLRMLNESVRNGWPVSPEMKQEAVEFCHSVMSDGRCVRNQLAAIKLLLCMDSLNLRAHAQAGGTDDIAPRTTEDVLIEKYVDGMTPDEATELLAEMGQAVIAGQYDKNWILKHAARSKT